MKRILFLSILILGGILSCGINPVTDPGTPDDNSTNGLSIDSPAPNASIAVPFDISGSISGKIVTIKVNGKSAVVTGNTWTVSFTSNDLLPLGMKQFDAVGFDSSTNQLLVVSRVFNITNNGSLLPGFAVSGSLTGYYSDSWKAVGILNGEAGYIYGVMDSSNFSFNVTIGDSLEIFAYYDNNPEDGIFETSDEISTLTQIMVIDAVSNDVVTNLPIPDYSFYTLTMSFTNNSFGLPLGVFVFNPMGGFILYDSSASTGSIINIKLFVDCAPGSSFYYGCYYDKNMNGRMDFYLSNNIYTIGESYFVLGVITVNSDTNLSANMNAVSASGTISGSGALDMDGIQFGINASTCLSEIVSGNYQMEIYINSADSSVISLHPFCYKDMNGNGLFDNLDFNVGMESGYNITNENGKSHIYNFGVDKFTLNYNATGDDAAEFLTGATYSGLTAGSSKSLDVYKCSSLVNHQFYITWDKNKNGVADSSEPSTGYGYFVSNQSVYNLDLHFRKLLLDVTVDNSAGLASYSYPRFENYCSFWDTSVAVADGILTNYWITNKSSCISYIRAYDDVNNNFLVDLYSGENYITTNDIQFNEYFILTNVTIYITN